jgi:hypothetical protein
MNLQGAGLYVHVELDGAGITLGCQRCGATTEVDRVAVDSLRGIVARFAKVHLTGCIPQQAHPASAS